MDDIIEKIDFDEVEKKEKKGFAVFLDYLIIILAAFCLGIVISKFVAVRSVVDGDSMNNTLQDHDNLIVEKVSYYFHEPERFDIIVFELKDEPGVHYIKRIIGLPGDTVQIKHGKVFINQEELTEDVYGNAVIENGGNASLPITVGEDEYFVLGDNRNDSSDSRFNKVGLVKKNQFLGKAVFRFFPFNKIKVLKK